MDKTNIDWWNANTDNLKGITVEPNHDQILPVAATYIGYGTLMVKTFTAVNGATEFPVYKVTPVFKEGRRESGLDLTLAMGELQNALSDITEQHERAIDEAVVDTDPKNPRTYLPAFAWPEYWQPGQKKAVIVRHTFGGIRNKDEKPISIGDVFTVEFAIQSSPDGQAIVHFINHQGKRQGFHWTFVIPYEG